MVSKRGSAALVLDGKSAKVNLEELPGAPPPHMASNGIRKFLLWMQRIFAERVPILLSCK